MDVIPAKYFEYIVMVLEVLLILLTAIFTLLALVWFGMSIFHEAAMLSTHQFDKEIVIKLLDITLLTLIIIDVLQIVVARYTSAYDYLRVAVEVGMLSMLRELISVEIRKPDPTKILSFSVAILILFFVWLGLNRIKVVDALKQRLLE